MTFWQKLYLEFRTETVLLESNFTVFNDWVLCMLLRNKYWMGFSFILAALSQFQNKWNSISNTISLLVQYLVVVSCWEVKCIQYKFRWENSKWSSINRFVFSWYSFARSINYDNEMRILNTYFYLAEDISVCDIECYIWSWQKNLPIYVHLKYNGAN